MVKVTDTDYADNTVLLFFNDLALALYNNTVTTIAACLYFYTKVMNMVFMKLIYIDSEIFCDQSVFTWLVIYNYRSLKSSK